MEIHPNINYSKNYLGLPGLSFLLLLITLRNAGIPLFLAALGFHPPDLTFQGSPTFPAPSGGPTASSESSERVRTG